MIMFTLVYTRSPVPVHLAAWGILLAHHASVFGDVMMIGGFSW